MSLDPLSRRLLSGAGENGFLSLMYHSVQPGEATPDWQWAVSFKQFCAQLSLLQDEGWTTVCAHQLTPEKIQLLPSKSVAITFDDGYADNFPAFEELARRNMCASWFIVCNDIGKKSSWVDIDAPSYPLLTSSQLQEMQSAGMEIGSHTLSHPRLTLCSKEQLDSELYNSRVYLSNLFKQPITSFAYPYGLYDQHIRDTVASNGYTTAFTTRPGFKFVDNDSLQIRRISIMANDSLATFARKLAFADNEVSWPKVGQYACKRICNRLHLK